jgi:toxin secretion/phage lysis holin
VKEFLLGIPAVAAGILTSIFGGWDTGLTVYLIFCLIDIITGTINAFLGKSDKTMSGAFNSLIGWKGLVKKLMTLSLIAMAHWLDILLGTMVIRDAAVFFFIFNEGTSILENCGHWIELPAIIQRALDVLKSQSDNAEL